MFRKRALFIGGLVLLVLALPSGCSLLARDRVAVEDAGYIQLRIQAPASKGITINDFIVTGLRIRVLDATGEEKIFDWAAEQGPQTYMVPVKQQGEHQLEVTHFGERDGEAVQAVETATFQIQPMKITVLDIVPGSIGLIWVPMEGPSSWLLWGTWANEEYNGWEGGPAAKIVILESGVVELYRNVGDLTPFETSQFTLTSDWTDAEAHWFRATIVGSPLHMLARLYDGGNTLAELIRDYEPDPGELDPSTGAYDVIYYRQE